MIPEPSMTETPALREKACQDRIAMLRRLIARIGQIEPAGEDRFEVPATASVFDRIYGGHLLAEALMAAAATVPADRAMHSMHCYFLRLGNPALPVTYSVERLRDTRTFSVRQVRAEQAGKTVTLVTFSFSASSAGMTHQWSMPEAPDPEDVVPRDVELIAMHGSDLPVNAGVPWPVDLRHVDQRPWDPVIGDGRHRVWMRVDERLPDDPLLHTALFIYASDLTMADAVTVQHPIKWEDLIAGRGYFGASLDHAVWLHAPVRADEWLLHVQESSRAANGRGFTTGRFFDRAGTLVASVAQEIFIKTADGEERR